MRKIEVPSDEAIKTECARNEFITGANISRTETVHGVYACGYKDAIAYANTQLQTVQEPKRPFLSDEEIDKKALISYGNQLTFARGARWTRDRYEEMLSQADSVKEGWQPYWPCIVTAWDSLGSDTKPIIGTYIEKSSQLYVIVNDSGTHQRSHCAELLSLYEIGKPP